MSGRPAQFNEGGEIPILVPQGLGQVAIEYKPFGTQVDFLPIVLGNGKIRLEVRPRVSDLDFRERRHDQQQPHPRAHGAAGRHGGRDERRPDLRDRRS